MERLRALSWSGLENFSRQILSLLFFFGIVRYLQPGDLGVYALAIAINSVMAIVIDEPIGEALVQKPTVTAEDWDTGFTINLGIALLCFLISLLGSGLIARLLHEPQLAYAVPVLSLAAVVGSLGNIQRAHMSRALRFRAIAQVTLLAQILGGATGVGMAILGFGYWSQIGMLFVGVTVMTMMFWRLTPWRPRLRLNLASIRSRSGYFASYTLVRSVYQLRDQSPSVIVGVLGGVAQLGFLSLAVRVVRSVAQLFEDLTSRPVLSLLSREQHELAGFGGVLLEILTIIGLVAIPAFVGLAAVGPTLIPLLFGKVWSPAGDMLPWVCAVLGGWLSLHVVIVSLRARGLSQIALRTTTIATVLDVIVLASLAPFRLDWALMGWAARSLLSLPVAVSMLHTYLGVPTWRLLRSWATPAVGSVLMVSVIVTLRDTTSLAQTLGGVLVMVAVGTAIYGMVALSLIPRAGWRRLRLSPRS